MEFGIFPYSWGVILSMCQFSVLVRKPTWSKIAFRQGCKFDGEGYRQIPQILMIPQYHIYIEFFPLDKKWFVYCNQSFHPLSRFLYLPVLAIISMCLMLLVSGIVTTATFTLMMQCSKRAPSHVQASHYTTLATLEVVGKLLFSVSLGSVTDAIGYENVFLLFLVLTTLVISFLQSCPEELIQHKEEVSVKDKSEWFFYLTD